MRASVLFLATFTACNQPASSTDKSGGTQGSSSTLTIPSPTGSHQPTEPSETGVTTDTGETTADTAAMETGIMTGDTGLVVSTADTGVPCTPISWYYDGDGDGVTGYEQVVEACEYAVAGWSNTPPTDCDDFDAGLQRRLSGTYAAPAGATGIVLSVERYDGTGGLQRLMAPVVDGVDGFTLDASVPGQVSFTDACRSAADQYYLSASFSGAAGSYSCVGTADPTYTAYGTFTLAFEGIAATEVYVNNYTTPLGLPFGPGPGCEVGAQ